MKTVLFWSDLNDLVFLQGTEQGEYMRELAYATIDQNELIKQCTAMLHANGEQHGNVSGTVPMMPCACAHE